MYPWITEVQTLGTYRTYTKVQFADYLKSCVVLDSDNILLIGSNSSSDAQHYLKPTGRERHKTKRSKMYLCKVPMSVLVFKMKPLTQVRVSVQIGALRFKHEHRV